MRSYDSGRSAPDAVFVDTGAWLAIQLDGDAAHRMATDAWVYFASRNRPLVTTNAVIGETYTYLRSSARAGYATAWRFLDWLTADRSVFQAFITAELERDAYTILRQYRDQGFSYVDATSFAFARSARITEAFAFDTHFATAGFTRVPLDRPLS